MSELPQEMADFMKRILFSQHGGIKFASLEIGTRLRPMRRGGIGGVSYAEKD